MGDLDGAMDDINAAIRLDPQLPSPLINRSHALAREGRLRPRHRRYH